MSFIQLNSVTKNFPKFTIGPCDLSIEKGELFGIFGPPSSGKTSILKIILGLLSPDSGSFYLDNEEITHLAAHERNFSMVFQNLALFPHMNGRDNILFPAIESNITESVYNERFDEVVDVLHISHILHKSPAQMSGGEKQRIALGRAFINKSSAILLDEPLSALDARLREEMKIELKRLQIEMNQTFVYVSHDEEEVLSISDRVGIMIDGKIRQIDDPSVVYDYPNSADVGRLIGSPPMNLFPASFDTSPKHLHIPNLDLKVKIERDGELPRNLLAGVRPEDFQLLEVATEDSFKSLVLNFEPLGSYTIVNLQCPNSEDVFKIRLNGQYNFEFKQSVDLTVHSNKIRLFNESEDLV
jgi:multiple sugar transport system ATP-binding protein